MNATGESSPPPPPRRRRDLDAKSLLLIALSLAVFAVVVTVLVMRFSGLARPFSVPTGTMSPAIQPGDLVVAERFFLRKRKPARGDIVVFRTDGLPATAQRTMYVKRIAGLPGEQLRLSEGDLIVDGERAVLSNASGRIEYSHPGMGGRFLGSPGDTAQVPDGCYFVLGDNTLRSLDSRHFGCIPATSIVGRVAFRYWPPGRAGAVK